MSWTAIAQTVVPAILAAQDDSVAETADDVSTTSGDIIKVEYPTSANGETYIEGNGAAQHWTDAGFNSEQDLRNAWFRYGFAGVFDAITYVMLNPDLIDYSAGYYASRNGDTITYNSLRLFEHWMAYGIKEGRCASPFFCVSCYLNENSSLVSLRGYENSYVQA